MSQHEDHQDLIARNQQLAAQVERQAGQLAAVGAAAEAMHQGLDEDRALYAALEAALEALPIRAAAIRLVDASTGTLSLRAQREAAGVEAPPLPLDDRLAEQAIREDRVVFSSVAEATGVPPGGTQALAPLRGGGQVTGVLAVWGDAPRAFAPDELDTLRALAGQVGLVLENARLHTQNGLHEQRLRRVIQSTADPVLVTDASGRIRLTNDAALRFLERGAVELLDQPLTAAPLPDQLRKALLRATQVDVDFERCDLALAPDLTATAVISRLTSSDPIHAPDGGWVIVLRDMRYARPSERARLASMQHLTHDLRNPLGVAMSSIAMLHDFSEAKDPELEEIYTIALEAIERMHHLLDDLLRLETIENGAEFELGGVDIRALLEQVLRDARPALEQKKQTLTLQAPSGLPTLRAAYPWLQLAVQNYVRNAIKYTPPGGQLLVEARLQEHELLIEVQDTGPGIPPDSQLRLFERFYRVPSVQEEVRGSGLGLALVRAIAEAHQGRVYVHSRPGEGSRFGLALPLH